MWNERYSAPEYIYGREPNDFLASQLPYLAGPILSLACGEGRNEVWMAQQGFEVHGVDSSEVGLKKAQELANEQHVTLHTSHHDLADFPLGQDRWGTIVMIFAHVPPQVRARLLQDILPALKPGGRLILECYSPRQLANNTGGPKDATWLFDPAELRQALAGLHIEALDEKERDVQEGRYHNGLAWVTQLRAQRT